MSPALAISPPPRAVHPSRGLGEGNKGSNRIIWLTSFETRPPLPHSCTFQGETAIRGRHKQAFLWFASDTPPLWSPVHPFKRPEAEDRVSNLIKVLNSFKKRPWAPRNMPISARTGDLSENGGAVGGVKFVPSRRLHGAMVASWGRDGGWGRGCESTLSVQSSAGERGAVLAWWRAVSGVFVSALSRNPKTDPKEARQSARGLQRGARGGWRGSYYAYRPPWPNSRLSRFVSLVFWKVLGLCHPPW